MILSSFFEGHGAEWSKIFLYGQLDHAKMSRIVQKLDAASASKAHNGQICICLKLAWAEKKGRDKSCVTQPIELCGMGTLKGSGLMDKFRKIFLKILWKIRDPET